MHLGDRCGCPGPGQLGQRSIEESSALRTQVPATGRGSEQPERKATSSPRNEQDTGCQPHQGERETPRVTVLDREGDAGISSLRGEEQKGPDRAEQRSWHGSGRGCQAEAPSGPGLGRLGFAGLTASSPVLLL